MKEIINEFKDIMSNKEERFEFIGSFVCALIFITGIYFSIFIFN